MDLKKCVSITENSGDALLLIRSRSMRKLVDIGSEAVRTVGEWVEGVGRGRWCYVEEKQ